MTNNGTGNHFLLLVGLRDCLFKQTDGYGIASHLAYQRVTEFREINHKLIIACFSTTVFQAKYHRTALPLVVAQNAKAPWRSVE